MIEVDNVTFWYDSDEGEKNKLILNDIDLEFEKGKFYTVIGHNGSGKSTLARHLNGILLPRKGRIIVEGIDTTNDEKLYDLRQKVGLVFQNPDNQIVATLVEDDVAFAPENLGIPPAEIRERVDFALKAVDMYDQKDRMPSDLSGGQKQRVAIAGIIAMSPQYIVLDEPTAMLDPKGRREVLKIIRFLNKEYGITIILITHFMTESLDADEIIVMNDGVIEMKGTAREIFSDIDKIRKIGLDVPSSTELISDLKKSGIPFENSVLTVEECIDEILKTFHKSSDEEI